MNILRQAFYIETHFLLTRSQIKCNQLRRCVCKVQGREVIRQRIGGYLRRRKFIRRDAENRTYGYRMILRVFCRYVTIMNVEFPYNPALMFRNGMYAQYLFFGYGHFYRRKLFGYLIECVESTSDTHA